MLQSHTDPREYKMYELKVVTDEVEDSRKLTNKLYENWISYQLTCVATIRFIILHIYLKLLSK